MRKIAIDKLKKKANFSKMTSVTEFNRKDRWNSQQGGSTKQEQCGWYGSPITNCYATKKGFYYIGKTETNIKKM